MNASALMSALLRKKHICLNTARILHRVAVASFYMRRGPKGEKWRHAQDSIEPKDGFPAGRQRSRIVDSTSVHSPWNRRDRGWFQRSGERCPISGPGTAGDAG